MSESRVKRSIDLELYLKDERAAVEAARAQLVDDLLRDAPATMAEPMLYALDAGGKRLRPVLCVAGYRAARSSAGPGAWDGEVPWGIYAIACAVEFIHTYSLIHDDLPCMDDDDLRRGRPTTHRVFGEAEAIAAGAAFIPLAALAVDRGGEALGLGPIPRMRMLRELCAAAGAGGMVGGQVLDLEAEGRTVSLEGLEAVHRRKTGALLAVAPRLGGIAAGASEEIVSALGRYGERLGLAFQIADDVLDVSGSTEALGKTAGRDQDLAKATYPALLGLDEARRRAVAEADAAVAELRRAGVISPALEALARYAVERDR